MGFSEFLPILHGLDESLRVWLGTFAMGLFGLLKDLKIVLGGLISTLAKVNSSTGGDSFEVRLVELAVVSEWCCFAT